MKISQQTIDILSNFSTINASIIIPEGSVIGTQSNFDTMYGAATVSEKFPREVPIYDLSNFLSAYSSFNDPDIEFKDTHMVISSGKAKIKYYYSNVNSIARAATELPELPSVTYQFSITKDELAQLNKMAATIKADTIGISKKGLRAYIKDIAASNEFEMNIDVTSGEHDPEELNISLTNFKLMPGNYDAQISAVGAASFVNKDHQISYVFALTAE